MRLATGSDDVADEPSSYKPPLHHLRCFGCVAYKLIQKQQRVDVKMGAHSKKCMMLGYVHNTTNFWKLWDPEQMKVTQCSDVKFDKATNFHTLERPANKNDVLGLPEEEPIYAEDRITLPPALQGQVPALQGHAPALQGHAPALQGYIPALQGHTPPALLGHTPVLQGHAPALQGHAPPALKRYAPALKGHAPPALQGHAPGVEHTPDEAIAATEYAPDEVVSASERLEP